MKITFKGNPIETIGHLPGLNTKAPDFTLTKTDLTELSLDNFMGKKLLLNVFLSLDTPVCASSVVQFNQKASEYPDTQILCISMDLPFALERFCSAKNIENVMAVSAFRYPDFGKNYGLTIVSKPLTGLLARAVIIINSKAEIIYNELVPEITQEPNYEAALKVLQ